MNPTLLFVAGLGASAAGLCLAGAVYGAHPLRKALSLTAALLLPLIAWAVPNDAPATAGLLAILTALGVFKWTQSVIDADPGGLRYRLWQWTSLFDVRLARPVPPAVEATTLVRAGAGLTLFVFSWTLIAARDADLLAAALGVLAVVSLADSVDKALRFLHRLLGWRVPTLMNDTFLPASVEEFWGRRWNRTVSRWLRRIVFRPVARQHGATAGLVAAFTVSAGIHCYIAWVPLNLSQGVLCGTFFLAQVPLILIERRWVPVALRRPYAYAALLLTAPAFVLPLNSILRGA